MVYRDGRLYIFNDIFADNGFIVKTKDSVFARVNKVGKAWMVWYYKFHFQKDFPKLREALADVDKRFIDWYRNR